MHLYSELWALFAAFIDAVKVLKIKTSLLQEQKLWQWISLPHSNSILFGCRWKHARCKQELKHFEIRWCVHSLLELYHFFGPCVLSVQPAAKSQLGKVTFLEAQLLDCLSQHGPLAWRVPKHLVEYKAESASFCPELQVWLWWPIWQGYSSHWTPFQGRQGKWV